MEETWRRVETGLGEWKNGSQIQCHGVGMYLLQRHRNTYQGGREYKCLQIHQYSVGQYLTGYC